MSVDKFLYRPGPKEYDFLNRGFAPEDWTTDAPIDRLVPTHCCFCGVQCAMYLKVSRGKVVGVEPREDFPVNQGRLCPKGVVAYQQVNHPDRLLYPLVRRNGRLERTTWDEAMSLIAERIETIQAAHGKDAVAMYGGSSLTTEKTYLIGKFARVALGTRHCDYNGRLCMTSAAGANLLAFNVDRPANPISDILLTDCLLVIGSNIPETFPVAIYFPWMARDRSAKLIVVDPRETQLARTADVFLQIRPGSDLALLNSLLHVCIEEGYTNPDFIANHTRGFEAVRDTVRHYPPERAAEICGVPPEQIVAAARLYGRTEKAMVVHARGLEHQSKGVDNCLAAINLVLATGKIGRPGVGYGTLTGQGNGQGGREQGQKADQLPGQRHIDNPEHRRYVAGVWGIPEEELPHKGASAVEMLELMHRGEIRAMIAICNNPMVSMPNLNWAGEALSRLELYVAIDFFLSDSAARYAHVVLPGSTWAEDEGVVANFEARVIKWNKAVVPPGEARIDWQILVELAERLGRGQFFRFGSPREIFDEMRVASHGGAADYYGMSYERIEAENGIFWPCPEPGHPGTPRMFEDYHFYHPDGRAVFKAVEHRPPAELPDDEYPLLLSTGRVVYHYLSGNQTRRLGFLAEEAPEPWVEIHPDTAARLGIRDGSPCRVVTRRGEATLRALVARTVRPDTIFVPYHWPIPEAANLLTNNALDPVSKIPEYKVCAARVEPA